MTTNPTLTDTPEVAALYRERNLLALALAVSAGRNVRIDSDPVVGMPVVQFDLRARGRGDVRQITFHVRPELLAELGVDDMVDANPGPSTWDGAGKAATLDRLVAHICESPGDWMFPL